MCRGQRGCARVPCLVVLSVYHISVLAFCVWGQRRVVIFSERERERERKREREKEILLTQYMPELVQNAKQRVAICNVDDLLPGLAVAS